MNYYEYTFTSDMPETVNEILTAYLAEIGFDMFREKDSKLQAYISEQEHKSDTINETEEIIKRIPFQISFSSGFIKDENWNQQWEKNFEPVLIDNRLMIRASFHPKPAKDIIDIVINPKMSFGTGHHATTTLMAKAVLGLDFTDKTVLDMGCGTGVLGISASKLGAKTIKGIDIDIRAYENAQENCEINKIKNMEIFLGDASLLSPEQKYDIQLANINRNIILRDLNIYLSALKHGGRILLSGFLDADKELILGHALSAGLDLEQVQSLDHWLMLQFKKM